MPSLWSLYKKLRTGQFWYLFPHYGYLWLRNWQAKKTSPVITESYGTPEIPEMHVLTGAAQIGDLIFAVKSFLNHYDGRIALAIHGDSSVKLETAKTIQHHFPSARVLMKKERDATVLPYLRERELSQCRAFREANVFGERLVDTAVLAQGDIVVNMDTDCLTFRPLSQFQAHLEQSASQAVYARDQYREPYSISKSKAQERFGVAPVPHFNAGFCAMPAERLDLRRIETWLEGEGYPMGSHFAEQTILAALAALGGSEELPREDYDVGRFQDEDQAVLIHYAAHYLSSTRIAMRREGHAKVVEQLRNEG